MGRKTHGPYVLAAIELNDLKKLSDILATKFRDRSKVKDFLTSEINRLASVYTEVPLMLAASLPDPEILKYLVEKHEVNINFVHEFGFQKHRKRKTALLVAVKKGLYATVNAILNLRADANFQDHKGRSCLHHAIRKADYRMVKLLVNRGAQVGVYDVSGNSPLHIATIFGHTELVKLLLKYEGDLYKKGQYGAIPIHMAAREGHSSIVRMFTERYQVNANAKVPCYDALDKSALHVAASQGNAETVQTLLEFCKADVNDRDSEGNTPLHYVALEDFDPLGMKSKNDYADTVRVLLNFGAEVNVQNARGETALHLAARNEYQKIIEVLILAGCDVLLEDNDRNKAINLVSEEDAVSRQALKSAAANRDRLMRDAVEVRAIGFPVNFYGANSTVNQSFSTINIPQAINPRYPQGYQSYQRSLNSIPYAANQQSSYSSSGSSRHKSKESLKNGPKLPPSMVNAIRKVRSVEDLDPVKQRRTNKADDRRRHRRKGSYQESEATSMWDVTPPESLIDSVSYQGDARRDRRDRHERRRDRGQRNSDITEVDETTSYGRNSASQAGESYYLDDESVNELDVRHVSKHRKHNSKQQKSADKQLDSWVKEQTKHVKQQKNKRDVISSSSTASASDTSEASEADLRQQKSRPQPLPKPSQSGSRSRLNTSIDKVIEVDIDDQGSNGQTVIRVTPVNPSGPTKTQVVPSGASSVTYLNLNEQQHQQQQWKGAHKSERSEDTSPKKKKVPTATLR